MSDAVKPPGGGNTKYVIGGLLLLLAALGVIVILLEEEPAPSPAPAPPPEPEQVERVNPLAETELILEEEDTEEASEEEVPEEEAEEPPKRATGRRDRWDCVGSLDVAALNTAMRNHRSQMRTCYERRLKVNNLLQGEVSLRVKVGPAGQVLATATSGSLNDKEVTDCMERQAKGWTLPQPVDGNCAVFEIPFRFLPKE